MPDFSEQISAMTIRSISGLDRPSTTFNLGNTKRTGNTGFELSTSRKSLLWRPKTTAKGSRMTINNENLAKGLVEDL